MFEVLRRITKGEIPFFTLPIYTSVSECQTYIALFLPFEMEWSIPNRGRAPWDRTCRHYCSDEMYFPRDLSDEIPF